MVIPWFGRELKGGAEQHAWQVASRLAGRGHSVEVLTTCCRSHQEDWSTNHLPPGRSLEPEGFAVRRFLVDARNRLEFDRACAHLLSLDPANLRPGVSPVSPAESHIFAKELIKSAQLLDFIAAHKEDFDAVVFLPYLYGISLDGIRIVGPTAALQPCLHDEAYAYLPEVAQAFRTAGSLLFISEGEQELALRLFGPGIWKKSTLTGAGIESGHAINVGASPLPKSPNHPEKFLLYLGRKDPGKNTTLLLDAFERFRRARPNSSLRLILAGHGSVDLNGHKGMVEDLGLVSETEKERLLRECSVLVQPSQNESFSRVIMESWLNGKPVAVHSRCLATAIAVERSRGGWVAETESDWARLFAEIDRMSASDLSALGERGRRYASDIANWESVMDRYEAALKRIALSHSPALSIVPSTENRVINQFLPNLAHGDAISNQALFIRDQLRKWGYRSDIYVRFLDPRVGDQCKSFAPKAVMDSDALIYHHSIGTEITPHIVDYDGPKCLIYHNITPAEFLEPYRPDFAAILRQGRADLHNLARHFPLAVGVSHYNAQELTASGFSNVEVLPLSIDPDKWEIEADVDLMRTLQDGRTNVLFVGRLAPNKKQDDLLRAFRSYLTLDPDARLIVVGTAEERDPYVQHLLTLITDLDLEKSVVLPGNIADAQLAAYYRTAHLFWSMSEHEGFCVPLIESMWFDIPVFAFCSSAVPETLGGAALMFTKKKNLSELAAAAHTIVTDAMLRKKIIKAQRAARSEFLPAKIVPLIGNLIKRLTGLG